MPENLSLIRRITNSWLTENFLARYNCFIMLEMQIAGWKYGMRSKISHSISQSCLTLMQKSSSKLQIWWYVQELSRAMSHISQSRESSRAISHIRSSAHLTSSHDPWPPSHYTLVQTGHGSPHWHMNHVSRHFHIAYVYLNLQLKYPVWNKAGKYNTGHCGS